MDMLIVSTAKYMDGQFGDEDKEISDISEQLAAVLSVVKIYLDSIVGSYDRIVEENENIEIFDLAFMITQGFASLMTEPEVRGMIDSDLIDFVISWSESLRDGMISTIAERGAPKDLKGISEASATIREMVAKSWDL